MNSVAEVLSGVGAALLTLLLIATPVSTAVIHSSIGEHFNRGEWNRQIVRSCLYLTTILVVFLLAGHFVMVASVLPALKSGLRRNDCAIPRIQDAVPDGCETAGQSNEGMKLLSKTECL